MNQHTALDITVGDVAAGMGSMQRGGGRKVSGVDKKNGGG